MTVTAAERTLLERCRAEPGLFLTRMLGADPHPAHRSIANALSSHSRVSVVGCNGSGKDWTSGRLILWWLSTRYPAKVVVLAPSHRQVHDIVWKECRMGYAGAVTPLGGRMLPRDSRLEYDDQHFAIGFAVDDAFNIQGFHSPNLLVILSEAHGIPQDQHDAVRRLNPSAILMTGNALGASGGEFYESHHERADLWETVTISADDIIDDPRPGMLTREQVAERAEEWGQDSPLYVSAVLAQWPDNADDALVLLADARAAVDRELPPELPAVLGVDVARYGSDASVIYMRSGPVARLVHRQVGASTMTLVTEVQRAVEEHEPEVVVVDAVGVGAGVVDRLKELDLPCRIVAFQGGASARDKTRFANAIAECWWGMSQAFRREAIDIEDDRRLVAQVTGRRYTERSDRTIALESKDDIRKRGGRSPDEADALAMTYYAPRRRWNYGIYNLEGGANDEMHN